ncbi:MAG: pterin-4-alpha-carbinolamine dehydratase, partial [Flavobacteriaceae bacterium]|nr:pterin-4-alpha-carbinolamine dehydratase [Flavobacteriaceae bacterium]
MNALSEKIITEKIKDFQDWTYHENAIHTSLE